MDQHHKPKRLGSETRRWRKPAITSLHSPEKAKHAHTFTHSQDGLLKMPKEASVH
jgi:hypothetical protein